MVTVRRTPFIWSAFFIVVSIACNIAVFSMKGNCNDQLFLLGYVLVVELICFIIANSATHGRVLNFAAVFVLVLFVFNFGQVMINTYFKNIYSHVRFLLLLNPEDSLYGFKYINLAFSTLCMGLLIATISARNDKISSKEKCINQLVDFQKLARNIILISFPVKLIVDALTLYVFLTSGGAAARLWLNTFPNVLVYYGKISLIGFAFLIITNKNDSKKQSRIFLFIEIYILLMMVSGIRSENVGYLLVFSFLYFSNRKKKIPIYKFIIYGVICVVLLAFIITVGEYRNVAEKSVESFFEAFNNSLTKKNVILSLLDTCGDTGYTAQCVITKWLPLYGPSRGESYYLGWFSALPNVPKFFTFPGIITEKSCFALKLQAAGTLSENYFNIGGSLIGEQFFNFGLIGGCIATFMIGIFLGKVSYKCYVCFQRENYYRLIRIIPIMFAATYWVRDYFGGEFREIIWGPLICYIVIYFQKRNSRYLQKQEK